MDKHVTTPYNWYFLGKFTEHLIIIGFDSHPPVFKGTGKAFRGLEAPLIKKCAHTAAVLFIYLF